MAEVPQHIAIILDGNGRWAKAKGMPRTYGHTMGAKNVEPICRAADALGVKYLTMYAFSTENWNRPSDEVAALMKLLESYMKNCLNLAKNNNMRVRVIGDKSKLDADLQASIEELERESAAFTGLNFQVAINYGSRDEIVRAVNHINEDIAAGKITGPVTEQLMDEYLDTKGLPAPDLLIRTSGEQRLSNFLLWQLAYTEFYFTDVHWPDFSKEELIRACEAYSSRDRRYGGHAREV